MNKCYGRFHAYLADFTFYPAGVMVYGGYYFGVTEANHCVVAVHYFSFLFGGRAWHFRPFAAFLAHGGLLVRTAPAAFPLQAIAQLRLWDLLAWLIVALALVNIIPQLHRVFRLAETKQVCSELHFILIFTTTYQTQSILLCITFTTIICSDYVVRFDQLLPIH